MVDASVANLRRRVMFGEIENSALFGHVLGFWAHEKKWIIWIGRTISWIPKVVQAPDEPMSNSRGREHHLKAWRFTLLHGCWSLQCGYCHGCQLRIWVLWWGSATRVNSRYFRCFSLSFFSEWIFKISRIPSTLWPSHGVLRFFCWLQFTEMH